MVDKKLVVIVLAGRVMTDVWAVPGTVMVDKTVLAGSVLMDV